MTTQTPARSSQRDFLRIADLDPTGLERLLGRAATMKARPHDLVDAHRLAMLVDGGGL